MRTLLFDQSITNRYILHYDFTAKVFLEGKFKSETIEISFDSSDEADMGDETNIDNSPTEDNDEEGPTMNFGIYFFVTITNSSGARTIFTCTASQRLIIDGVRYLEAGEEITTKELYGGPTFDHLNEDLQDSLYDYLLDRNINGEMCLFVIYYSRFKEEYEYLNWLNKVSTFTT